MSDIGNFAVNAKAIAEKYGARFVSCKIEIDNYREVPWCYCSAWKDEGLISGHGGTPEDALRGLKHSLQYQPATVGRSKVYSEDRDAIEEHFTCGNQSREDRGEKLSDLKGQPVDCSVEDNAWEVC